MNDKAKDKIIVALDVETPDEARSIVDEIGDGVGAYKIGLQLFTAAGPAFVREIVGRGARVFLDVKYHDIPTTVAKASVEAARLGVWMFNVHCSGGGEMLSRAADAVGETCAREGIARPLLIGVTVLTSSDQSTLGEVGVATEIGAQVVNLARLAAKCGLDGVVASPHEIAPIRAGVEKDGFVVVTPGIRPVSATNDDQKRVMTPADAVRLGADHLVIGRPITQAADRAAAAAAIVAELEHG